MIAEHVNSNSVFGQLFCNSTVHFLEQVMHQTWGKGTQRWHEPKGTATAVQVSLHAPRLPCCLSLPALRQRTLQPWETPRLAEAARRLLQATAAPETQGLLATLQASQAVPAIQTALHGATHRPWKIKAPHFQLLHNNICQQSHILQTHEHHANRCTARDRIALQSSHACRNSLRSASSLFLTIQACTSEACAKQPLARG